MKKGPDSLNFSFFQWILISIRVLILINVIGWNYLIQKLIVLISPLFPFQIWKRYLSCFVNLITNRIALMVLGCFQIESQGFKYFSKSDTKIILKSGHIGLGTHKNVMDFLYYSMIFNPLFVRLILIVDKEIKDGKDIQFIKDVNYAPLYFEEALECAMSNRGFDPIIIRNDKQLKQVKYRKMNMKTLVSESFEELRGAIFILLPVPYIMTNQGMKHDEHIQIEQKVVSDVYDNETKYLRSGVGLKVHLGERQVFQRSYKNQLYFLFHVMSELKLNQMSVEAMAFRSNSFTTKDFKNMYSKPTYRDFMQENFFLMNEKLQFKKMSYLEYLENKDLEHKKQADLIGDKAKKNH